LTNVPGRDRLLTVDVIPIFIEGIRIGTTVEVISTGAVDIVLNDGVRVGTAVSITSNEGSVAIGVMMEGGCTVVKVGSFSVGDMGISGV